MNVFSVPITKLKLFLVALNMNFDLPAPDFIFQLDDRFEVCYTKSGFNQLKDDVLCNRVESFVDALWEKEDPSPPQILEALKKMSAAFDIGQVAGPDSAIDCARVALGLPRKVR